MLPQLWQLLMRHTRTQAYTHTQQVLATKRTGLIISRTNTHHLPSEMFTQSCQCKIALGANFLAHRYGPPQLTNAPRWDKSHGCLPQRHVDVHFPAFIALPPYSPLKLMCLERNVRWSCTTNQMPLCSLWDIWPFVNERHYCVRFFMSRDFVPSQGMHQRWAGIVVCLSLSASPSKQFGAKSKRCTLPLKKTLG